MFSITIFLVLWVLGVAACTAILLNTRVDDREQIFFFPFLCINVQSFACTNIYLLFLSSSYRSLDCTVTFYNKPVSMKILLYGEMFMPRHDLLLQSRIDSDPFISLN